MTSLFFDSVYILQMCKFGLYMRINLYIDFLLQFRRKNVSPFAFALHGIFRLVKHFQVVLKSNRDV